jgi:hypothetical protein
VDARDDLRAALNRSREEAEQNARAGERAVQDKARYEHEVREAKAKLYEAAELTTKALGGKPLTSIEVEPKRSGFAGLFDQPKRVEGWRVCWRGEDAVLCPDGSLFVPRLYGAQYVFRATSLKKWIDRRIDEIGTYRGESGVNDFERAFTLEGGDEDVGESLRSALERVSREVVADLARLLRDRGGIYLARVLRNRHSKLPADRLHQPRADLFMPGQCRDLILGAAPLCVLGAAYLSAAMG